MCLINKLVNRGNAVIREFGYNNDLNDYNKRMISNLSAVIINNLCRRELETCTKEQMIEKVNFLKTALISAFHIGKACTAQKRPNERTKEKKHGEK